MGKLLSDGADKGFFFSNPWMISAGVGWDALKLWVHVASDIWERFPYSRFIRNPKMRGI